MSMLGQIESVLEHPHQRVTMGSWAQYHRSRIKKKRKIGFILATRVLRVTPCEPGSRQVSRCYWARVIDERGRKAQLETFVLIFKRARVFSPERRQFVRSRGLIFFFNFLQFSPSNRVDIVSSTRVGEYRVDSPIHLPIFYSIRGIPKLGFVSILGVFDSRFLNRLMCIIQGQIEAFRCRLV